MLPAIWKRAIYVNPANHANPDVAEGGVHRDAYAVLCWSNCIKDFGCADVYAAHSRCWSDPRTRLLDGENWDQIQPEVLDGLGLVVDDEDLLRPPRLFGFWKVVAWVRRLFGLVWL